MTELVRLDGPVDGVATITLDRPTKRNALSVQVRNELSDLLDALGARQDVRAVVLTGAGDVFCAGFDLQEFQNPDADFGRALWASSDRYHRTVMEFPLPLIAAINGPAIAGGFDLAVMCDIRVASTTARFSHPEIRFGDVVYGPLHDAVGGAVARDLCLSGREITAAEALALHVVTTVCEPDDLASVAGERAALVASASREVLVRTKAKMGRRAGVVPGATLDL